MGQTHLTAVSESHVVAVSAVVEPRETVADDLRSRGLTVFDSIGAMREAGGVDGYLVATPSAFHVDVVRELIPTGLPILCEKPCGLSLNDATQIKSMVDASGVRFQVGYWRRFVPSMLDLKERIASHSFGRPLLVHAQQWDHLPPSAEFRNSSGGIVVDMGVHEIDLIHWLTGQEITSVNIASTWSDAPGVSDEDAAAITMSLSGGTIGLATVGRFNPEADLVSVEVIGESGREYISVLDGNDGERMWLEALRAQAESFARGHHVFSATIDDAISTLRVVEQSREKST
jgi:myo-inositol 2-dehydrogenase/D-chiro-inositol 1-dehydrogenase